MDQPDRAAEVGAVVVLGDRRAGSRAGSAGTAAAPGRAGWPHDDRGHRRRTGPAAACGRPAPARLATWCWTLSQTFCSQLVTPHASRLTRCCAGGLVGTQARHGSSQTIAPAGPRHVARGTIRPRSDTTRAGCATAPPRGCASHGPGALTRPPGTVWHDKPHEPGRAADRRPAGDHRRSGTRCTRSTPGWLATQDHRRLPDPRRAAVPGGDGHRAVGAGGPRRAGRAGHRPGRPGHRGGHPHPPGSRGRHWGHRRDVPGGGDRGARAGRPAPGGPEPADGQRAAGLRGRAGRGCSASCAPTPAERIRARGGTRLASTWAAGGWLDSHYSPGHAKHHVGPHRLGQRRPVRG